MTENLLIAAWNVGIVTLLFASQNVDISVRDTVICGAIIGLIGGIAAATREIQNHEDDRLLLIIKYALNTAMMGVAIALIFAEQTYIPRVVILGIIAGLSLGGLETVDLVVKKIKKKTKLEDDDEDLEEDDSIDA